MLAGRHAHSPAPLRPLAAPCARLRRHAPSHAGTTAGSCVSSPRRPPRARLCHHACPPTGSHASCHCAHACPRARSLAAARSRPHLLRRTPSLGRYAHAHPLATTRGRPHAWPPVARAHSRRRVRLCARSTSARSSAPYVLTHAGCLLILKERVHGGSKG